MNSYRHFQKEVFNFKSKFIYLFVFASLKFEPQRIDSLQWTTYFAIISKYLLWKKNFLWIILLQRYVVICFHLLIILTICGTCLSCNRNFIKIHTKLNIFLFLLKLILLKFCFHICFLYIFLVIKLCKFVMLDYFS